MSVIGIGIGVPFSDAIKSAGGSSWTPLDLSNLVAWYDVTDISTLFQDDAKTTPVTADSQPVGAIVDKSGNGYDLLQASALSKPLYRTNQINGLPAVVSDNVDDGLKSTGVAVGDCSIMSLSRVDAAATSSAFEPLLGWGQFSTSGGSRMLGTNTISPANVMKLAGFAGGDADSTFNVDAGVAHVWGVEFSTNFGKHRFWRDRSSYDVDVTGKTALSDPEIDFAVAGSFNGGMSLTEGVLTSDNLSDEESLLLRNYLYAKGGI